jgi:glutamine amidotransferase
VCRHIAYLGPARTLADLLLHRPCGLLQQSWAPCDMRGGGTVNAEPVRYRRAVPMWTDANFAAIADVVSASAVLAAVRSATVGMPVIDRACAPFTWDGWLFSHNGRITGWPDSVAGLASMLPVTDLLTLDAPTDSALLSALLRKKISAGMNPADAVAGLACDVAAAAPGSRLNFMLTDGATVVATAWDHSLSVLTGPDQVVVASEPWDDDAHWHEVPDRHLVVADRSGVQLRDLT